MSVVIVKEWSNKSESDEAEAPVERQETQKYMDIDISKTGDDM